MKKIAVLGKFDGVHIGHRALLGEAKRIRKDEIITVYTFNSGKNDIYGDAYKKYLLEKSGADSVVSFAFEDLKDMSAESFAEMLKKDGVSYAVCGFNYTFGKDRAGDASLLKELFRGNASAVGEIRAKLDGKEITVSSSLIRKLLSEGRIKEANRLLGDPYCIESEVIAGKKLGRTLGFPTVNQKIYGHGIKSGVYASVTEYEKVRYPSVTNVGICPTFGREELHAETNIIGFEGDLYGKKPKVILTDFIREEIRFDSFLELTEKIAEDREYVLKSHAVENF